MFLFFALWSGLAFASDALTLEQYLSEVRAHNPSLAAARARAGAAESRVSPAGAWDDPFFAVGIDQIPTRGQDMTSVWRYQLSQAIPFPGKRGAKGAAAEERAKGSRSDAAALERELILIATQLFYRAHYVEAALESNASLQNVLEGAVSSAQARYKTGGASHHEWLLARAGLAVLNVEKLRLERERRLLQARLNETRGQSAEIPLGRPAVRFTGARMIEPSLQGQPELKAFSAAAAAAEAEERSAKLAFLPDFVAQGMLMKPHAMVPEGMTSSMPASNWGFMVGINVPLFFPWKQSPLVSAARFDREAADLERQSLENRLRTEIVDAQEQLKTARNVVDLYQKSVIPGTKLAAENARTAYAARRFPLAQYLDALKAERLQELELVAARIDVEIAAARLENLLSAPPIARFAPSRPALFGGMTGGRMGEMPEATSMGRGTIAPQKPRPAAKEPGGGGGMEGM